MFPAGRTRVWCLMVACALGVLASRGSAVSPGSDTQQSSSPPPPATAQPQPPHPPAPLPPPAPGEKPVDPALREALQQYATALESLDADAVKKVQPSVDVDGLKRAFREMRSLDVDIDNVKLLSSDQSSARISCRVAQTLTPKAGSRQATTVTRVLLLRRQDTGWVIQAFER